MLQTIQTVLAGLIVSSTLWADSLDHESVEEASANETELSNQKSSYSDYYVDLDSPNNLLEYPAYKAMLSILGNFDEDWMLERVDSEWQQEQCFLRFHFQTRASEPMIYRAQINPITGDVLSGDEMNRKSLDSIIVSSAEAVGNVAASETDISASLRNLENAKNHYFRDIEIFRRNRKFLNKTGLSYALVKFSSDNIILVRRRSKLNPNVLGTTAITSVYDERTGEPIIFYLGDLLKEREK